MYSSTDFEKIIDRKIISIKTTILKHGETDFRWGYQCALQDLKSMIDNPGRFQHEEL